MGLIPLGILSSGAGSFGTYELIETQILGSATASVTLSGLASYASAYKHLQIRIVARTERAGFNRDLFFMRLNGDTASNYNAHGLFGAGNAVFSAADATSYITLYSYAPALTAPTGQFGTYIVDLLDAYSTTKNKTTRSLSGGIVQSSESGVALSSGLWRSTSAITSATLLSGTGSNLSIGSRFSIYGIR
jgi:hypothetical protein